MVSLKGFLSNRISLIIIAALIISALALLATYYFAQQQTAPAKKSASSQETVNLPTSQLVTGKISQAKGNLLTIKQNTGQDIEIKMATGAAILKQKRFGPNSVGTVPASNTQTGNEVAISAVKDAGGNLEANLVVILDPEIK